MKSLKKIIIKLYHDDRSVLVFAVIVFVCALGLFVYSLTKLNPASSVVKVGYGDIGGYRDGNWTSLLAFPILAILFGVLHNMLALRIYEKRGSGMAKLFLIITITLIVDALLVLLRLSSEVQ